MRETPLSSIALENALKLSREGVVIMPVSPPWYRNPADLDDLVRGFTDKVLGLLGEDAGPGWRERGAGVSAVAATCAELVGPPRSA